MPEIVEPQAARLRLAVLVHLPLADETGLAPDVAAELDARERRTLRAAAAVVVTSAAGRARGWPGTAWPPTGCTSPSPASTRRRSPPAPTGRPGCSAWPR